MPPRAGQREQRKKPFRPRTTHTLLLLWLAFFTAGSPHFKAAPAAAGPNPYQSWTNGPSAHEDFFPLGVWLQSPNNAARYRAAGINLYVGLWRGPTAEQLATLKAAGMRVICAQNTLGLEHRDDPTIVGWMHGDEPDNAQSLGEGKGWGPPIPPAKIVADYQRIRRADPSRPVLLNLGQGVAWDNWHGRGVRTRHPEDYVEYVQGCDIVSFDIYPAAHDSPEVSGKLWFVAQGVERLRGWAGDHRPVWNCIECTHIQNKSRKATPHQVKAEVWMSLIHGSRGLIYFVHEWEPRFNEAALLADAEMLAAVTAVNRRIASLAPVLNTPTVSPAATVATSDPDVPVATLLKRRGDETYLFAVGMRDRVTTARFVLPNRQGRERVEVLDEDRSIELQDGTFTDRFDAWDVHLYRLASR